ASDYDIPDPVPQRQDVSSSTDGHVPSQQELDLLFAPSTPRNVHAEENTDTQAEEGEHLQDDEFTNSFCAMAQEEAESSSHNIGCSVCYCPIANTLISAVVCTSAIGSSSYMGLISASFPDLLLVS
nr:hypothetical protein [Tanacetum cinerariifolium]